LLDLEISGNLVMSSVDFGVFLNDLLGTSTSRHVNGNIICSNPGGGLSLADNTTEDAEGNWWDDSSGPTHPNNPGGSGDLVQDGANGGSGTVDYDPWIETITGSADPASEGEPSDISFQFSGGSGTVFLGEGPGDLNGQGTFTLTTDNGVLTSSEGTGATVHEFINQPNGTLEVSLTPDDGGDATVTITGPCGLEESVVVDVESAPKKPHHHYRTATPTQPPPTEAPPAPAATPFGGPGGVVVGPPTTGSGPSGGGFPWTLMALALAGVAGAAATAGTFLRFGERLRR